MVQERLPPGEVGAPAVGDVPDGRQGAGEGGYIFHRARFGFGEGWRCRRFGSVTLHSGEQSILGGLLVQARQVDVGYRPKQAFRVEAQEFKDDRNIYMHVSKKDISKIKSPLDLITNSGGKNEGM